MATEPYKLLCRLRLMVRTLGSHPRNRGSIPLGGTNAQNTSQTPFTFFVNYNHLTRALIKFTYIIDSKKGDGTVKELIKSRETEKTKRIHRRRKRRSDRDRHNC